MQRALVPPGASGWLLDRLTDSGRISFRLACDRLTPWELALLQQVLGRPDVEFTHEPSTTGVQVTVSALRGVAFWRPDGDVPPPEATTHGWLRVPPEVLDAAAEEAREAAAREAADFREVEGTIARWAAADELDDRLRKAADWVERVETVYVFIGRDVFSKSDAGSNTLTRDGLFVNLLGRPPATWQRSEMLFLVAVHCLFASGRSVRFEEFNGRQLSATSLRRFLQDRYANYCAAVSRDPAAMHRLSLFELAGQVRELLAEVDRSATMRYRRINGLTFVKTERLLDFDLPRVPDRMPALVAEYGTIHLGVPPDLEVPAAVRAMTRAAAALDADNAGPAPEDGGTIGELIAAIVLSAVTVTASDYGMSSGCRDLATLRGADPGATDGVLAMRKGDFFCCCLPHVARMATLPDTETVPILWRSAQRMMYNRWHFIPGEFDRADIPSNRHYFFPPQVPDIAEHSEHHHGGHIASRVRYSIRAPGAQVWLPPFQIFGHGFRGCYDIRLVRMDGPPFTVAEMRTTVRHCSLVDEVWRTLATGVEQGTFPVPPIGGFDRRWYESSGWERLRPFAIAAETHTRAGSP